MLLKHARVVGLGEIEENEFNLHIPRYVDTFDPEPRIKVKDALKALGEAENSARDAECLLRELLKGAGYAQGMLPGASRRHILSPGLRIS
jgi:type I restriction enzyme M protein